MPKVDVIQTSFVGGEFGPSLFGRTDVAQYANACAIVENWLIRPFGSIISAPGTEYINACKTGGSTTLTGIKLIPFVFSTTDAYQIEMGVGYFRFYTNGSVVVSPGTTPYEVAHSYAAADIPSIQYCQDHDVVYFFHGNYPTATLTRYGATSWSFSTLAITGGPFMPDNITSVSISTTGIASGSTVTVTASSAIFTVSGSTMGHVGTFWKYGSTVTSSTTGLAVQGFFKITAVTNSSIATATVISTLSQSGSTTSWAEGSWSSVRGYPARGAFHQQRLFMARTDNEPQTVWGSGSFVYTNFAVNGGADDDALNLRLSATQGNDIKWLAPMQDLIVGTYGGEFCISAGIGTGNPLTPSNVGVTQQTSWGSEPIPPKKIGNFAYYIQRYGQKLREIFYVWQMSNYKSVDKTILSPQVAGGGFIDMAYQQNPDTVLWLVCSNGTIATMTREVDQEVSAWSRHTTLGSYSCLAVIPSQQGAYDEVWVVVKRVINGSAVNYIERFKNQTVPTQQDQCFYVHSGASYNAFTANTTATISLSATAGTSVVVTSSSAYFSAAMVNKRIRAVDAFDNILGEMLVTTYASSTVVVGNVRYAFSSPTYSPGAWGVSVSQISGLNWLEAATVKVCADGGTDYPAKVVSNGSITLAYDYFVVTAGLPYTQILKTLPPEAGSSRGTSQGKKQRISEVAFKLNNSYRGFKVGGAASNLTSLSYIDSLSGSTIYVGTIPNPNFVLSQTVFRNPTTLLGTPELLFTGTLPNVHFQDDYRYGAQVLIENSDPLPIEILSLMTTVETFDK
jgi:hypothetical protein